MSQISVLITSAGRRVGLSNTFRDAGARLGCAVRVIAADHIPELSAACQLADKSYQVPVANDPKYVEALLNIVEQESIRLVIPTIDTELLSISSAVTEFTIRGALVNTADAQFVRVARDKLITSRILTDLGVQTPKTWVPNEVTGTLPLPVIVKPRDGSSSKGIYIVHTEADWAKVINFDNSVIQEFLVGPEYTVNVYYNQEGHFCAAIPHQRLETRQGEMSKGRTERQHVLTEVAKQMGKISPGVRGAFCFQVIITENGPVVFEINARFGGGYTLAHHAGGRFSQWLIEEALNLPSSASDEWRENVTALRFDQETYR